MLRRVMVCLDDRPCGRMSLESALQFATGYGATLTGLMIREPASVPAWSSFDGLAPAALTPGGAIALEAILVDHQTEQDINEDRLLNRYREACRARGLAAVWRVATGFPGEVIPLEARTFDMVVIGRGQKPDDALGSVAASVVRDLACPVLIVSREPDPLSTIAVAFDGSHGADRALALAADIATCWKGEPIAVVLIGVSDGTDRVAEALIEAERYLDIYHLAHRTCMVEGNPAAVIPETAQREKAGLLVMGAYGHSRARELLLGSTTHDVIAAWKGQLLLWR